MNVMSRQPMIRRVEDGKEIERFKKAKKVCLFSNFQQLLCGETDADETMERARNQNPDTYCSDVATAFFTDEKGDYDLYDLGSGYYIVTCRQEFHKLVEMMGKGKAWDFPFTSAVYRVVE